MARFSSDPRSATTIMGTRIASVWKWTIAAPAPVLHARAPIPIAIRRPLIATMAPQILWSRAKKKLDHAITPRLRTSSSGTMGAAVSADLIGSKGVDDIRCSGVQLPLPDQVYTIAPRRYGGTKSL